MTERLFPYTLGSPAASRLGVSTRSLHSLAVASNGHGKRRREDTTHNGPRRCNAPNHSDRAKPRPGSSRQMSRAGPSTAAPPAVHSATMTPAGEARERRLPTNLQLPRVAEAGGVTRGLEDCISLSRAGDVLCAGRCIICGGDNHPFGPT
jgi:hypothetical protein